MGKGLDVLPSERSVEVRSWRRWLVCDGDECGMWFIGYYL